MSNIVTNKTIHALFEEQVQRTPNHTALIFEGVSYTYQALNAESNQLAHYIRKHYQVKPDTPIVIQMARCNELIVALLGVLKSGAAYVPIDMQEPSARLDYILNDTKAKCVLDHGFFQKKPYLNESTAPLTPNSTSCNLAYVMYTSGTTGNPKGVMVEHGGVYNYLCWQARRYHLSEQDVVLHKIPFQFDISVWEIFGTLQQGATLVITRPEGHKDNDYLSQLMLQYGVTCAYFVPSMLSTFTRVISRFPETLRTIFCVGETLTPSQLNAAYQKCGAELEIHNLYGPTEATINVTAYACPRNADLVPIGKPIQNMRVYVLSPQLKLLPAGAIGELYISGVGVARGYLNQPELTDANFILNPFLNDGSRMYKTGDLVRWLSDGNLEYLGRNDFQVKIRGYRIELSEIEHTLNKHPLIYQSVVVLSDGKLVGYYVGDAEHLEDYLTSNLPHYMVPSLLIRMESFPLTRNGKLDRKALPLPNWEDNRTCYIAPRDEMERLVCRVWKEILNVTAVGIEDDFFKLGGHSVLAIQASHQMSRLLHREVSVADLFKYRTVSKLCILLKGRGNLKKIPLFSGSRAPLSCAQERLWFFEQYEQEFSPYHLLLTFKHTPTLLDALHDVIGRHEILRTRFVQDELGTYQEVHDEKISVETVSNPEDFIHRKFDLTSGHPLRVGLYEGSLLLVIHHIAFDEWSMEQLYQELMGHVFPLEIQYKDFAAWQRKEVEFHWDELKEYWIKKLSEIEILQLPTDYPRPSRIDYRGASIGFDLPFEIQSFSERYQVTPYVTCLTVLGILLCRYTGQNDITIGTPVANRQHPQLASLIGFFVNTLVIRFSLKETSFIEILQGTQMDLIEAQSYQDMPFEKLVDILDVERDPSRHPIFQVMYSVQYRPDIKSEDESFYESAKFDLGLLIQITPTQIKGRIQYATSLFKKETIERFISHYQILLSEILKFPEKSLNQFSLLSPEEYQQLIYTWNETDKPYDKKTLHSIFEAQVKYTPNHMAVAFAGQSLTYHALNAQSNQLAHYLRKHYSIKPNALIAIHMMRSLDLIVALLGVLKSGGAYVPIDIDYPPSRVDFILEDTAPILVLNDVFFQKKLFLSEPTHNPTPLSKAHDLAYVIYTSGTTGAPKGVMVEHGGVANVCMTYVKCLPIYSESRLSQYLSIGFDASYVEIFPALFAGASLHIMPDAEKQKGQYGQYIRENRITVLAIPPDLLTHLKLEDLTGVKSIHVGGSRGNAAVFARCAAGRTFINMYGLTESSITATMFYYGTDVTMGSANVIGKPLPGVLIYVLDAHLNPLPIGAVGELYIGG
ncbi:non-ribosomal peptide synthetase, partial [Legionella oakridgensis]|uniref:non-ribosomal peptide synthetase n=1 Tax=Legionella oakridgensis TaxID=29423 RepID=UPI000561D624